MKKLLILLPLGLMLQSCDWHPLGKEPRSVLFYTMVVEPKTDIQSIKFIAYRTDTKKPLDLDSMGQNDIRMKLDKPFPQSLGAFGLPFEKAIKKAPKGYYEVEARFRNGAYVRKKFGEIKGEESHLEYDCLISGDSTIEVRPK